MQLLNKGCLRRLVAKLVYTSSKKKDKDPWPIALPRPRFVTAVLKHWC
jgi:hypothetical protein